MAKRRKGKAPELAVAASEETVAAAPSPLVWRHAAEEVGEQGRSIDVNASAKERAAIAEALGLDDVLELSTSYRIRPRAGGRYVLKGTIRARIVQTCVVTLEPFENVIEEAIGGEYWPPDRLPVEAVGSAHVGAGDADDPLPLVEDRIEAGQLVFETLALAIDLHPRRPDAAFVLANDPGESVADKPEDRPNPFAVLAKLKPGKS